MEEDIKILEEFIKKFYESFVPETIIYNPEIKAMENLIKGYREKEESEAYLYDAYQDAGKKMFEYSEQLEDSIPKSKVKEKMEELDKKIRKIENKKVWNEPADTVIRNRLCNYYNALKELMEDK